MNLLNSTNCTLNFGLHCLILPPNQTEIEYVPIQMFFSNNKFNFCSLAACVTSISITSFNVSSFWERLNKNTRPFCDPIRKMGKLIDFYFPFKAKKFLLQYSYFNGVVCKLNPLKMENGLFPGVSYVGCYCSQLSTRYLTCEM